MKKELSRRKFIKGTGSYLVELIRFALSLNGPSGIVLGMEKINVVKATLELLVNFKPLSEDEKTKMSQTLSLFFRHENLEWMKPTYQDGNWA